LACFALRAAFRARTVLGNNRGNEPGLWPLIVVPALPLVAAGVATPRDRPAPPSRAAGRVLPPFTRSNRSDNPPGVG
jgi:hypothetical protein